MRYFNTHGPVNAEQHYVVSRQLLVNELVAQIDQGKYFTIFAPRQMGKTTLLRNLEELLTQNPACLPIPLSFERFESWSATDFMDDVGELIDYHINQVLQSNEHPQSQEIKIGDYPHLWRNATEVALGGPLAAKPAFAGWQSCPRRWTFWL